MRYCWRNPVKHGYVVQVVDWEWSSIHRDLKAGCVEAEWATRNGLEAITSGNLESLD